MRDFAITESAYTDVVTECVECAMKWKIRRGLIRFSLGERKDFFFFFLVLAPIMRAGRKTDGGQGFNLQPRKPARERRGDRLARFLFTVS